MLATQRHIEGREHTGAVLNWWIRRCCFTHTNVTALAAWVCGDSTWLQSSQVSHLRNRRMRTPQFKLFEGISAVNEAIATWQQQGKPQCLKKWGPTPDQAPSDSQMDAALFLWHPDQEARQPLVFHDFCDLFAGRLRLPYVDEASVSPGQSRIISDRISQELEQWLTSQRSLRAGMAKLLDLYPSRDSTRVAKLRDVILGADSYTVTELELELVALTELFIEVWGEPVDSKNLYSRLSSK
jgi:hypothetical protein